MAKKADIAHEVLDRLCAKKELLVSYEENLSEADTRCKIIDVLFKDVLGWDERNITREEYSKGEKIGYVDYWFKSDANSFILEAKRNGVYFNVPTSSRRVRTSGVLSRDKKCREALEQQPSIAEARALR